MKPEISLIIPTYNEGQNIKPLLSAITKILKNHSYEIIIVDDDSPDRTWEVAKKLTKKYPLKVIRRLEEKGLSSAVLCGFEHAKGNILGVMDADLSHPPKALPKLISLVRGGADMSIGSRLTPGGIVEDWPVSRQIISWGARIIARPLTNVKDIMSGMFFIKKETIKDVQLKPRGYKICLEILVKGKCNNIVEVPIIFRNREVGESKLTSKIYIEYLKQLGSLYWYKITNLFRL